MTAPALDFPPAMADDTDPHDELAALATACAPGVALCTIVGIDGSFSRRLGAQLAVRADGSVVGTLSDGCLERQLASDARALSAPETRRYGHGSPLIDFRLPCGGGLDILIDPAPDRAACRAALARLEQRRTASLALPDNPLLARRDYIPRLRVTAFGEGPELESLALVAQAAGIAVRRLSKDALSLGRAPDLAPPDRWTAVVLLFHDHEWEAPLLRHALTGESFYIGAQGGAKARLDRTERLARDGVAPADIARVRGPVGLIPGCRTPRALALSILGEILAEYEALQPHN